jgi:hypothetical protein
VFLQSLLETSSKSLLNISYLTKDLGESLGIETDGSNAFSKIRFAIPYLCDFKGSAIFLDGADMLMRCDLKALWDLRDHWKAVQVCKHDYRTSAPRKYIGTELEADNPDYPRKQWSSVVIWRCDYSAHQRLTPEFIAKQPGSYLHRFSWLPEDRIGELPLEFNHLVGEQKYNPQAKVAHFTLGIPGFSHYGQCDYADEWKKSWLNSQQGTQYELTVKR